MYSLDGKRTHVHPSKAPIFDREHLPHILPHITHNSHILIGSVTDNEVSVDLLYALKQFGVPISITLQGYFRRTHPDSKRVTEGPFPRWQEVAGLVDTIFLSDEDIRFSEGEDMLGDLIGACSQVILTKGEKGVTIFRNGESTDIPSFPLTKNETGVGACWTGAGETWTTVFMAAQMQGFDLRESAARAHMITACKIQAREGVADGIDSIPSRDEVMRWQRENWSRVEAYTKQVELPPAVFLDPEILLKHPERR